MTFLQRIPLVAIVKREITTVPHRRCCRTPSEALSRVRIPLEARRSRPVRFSPRTRMGIFTSSVRQALVRTAPQGWAVLLRELLGLALA